MSGHHCNRCAGSLHPGALSCAGCSARVVYGATGLELSHATRLGVVAMLSTWCYLVQFSLPAIVAGVAATATSGLLLRLAASRSRAHLVRTMP
jgi:hypothetical protein